MRRLIVSSPLLLAAALCALALLGTPAGAAGSVPHICPQQPSVIVPCCPLPTNSPGARPDIVPCCPQSGTCCPQSGTPATCCTATTCCTTGCTPGSLTIAASPDPSKAGQRVVISGALTNSPPGGAQVVLWRQLSGQSSFHQVAQATTDSAGRYTITLKRGTVNAAQQWYVTADGLRSQTLKQQVLALVALSASTRTVAAGKALALRGHVTPSHAGQMILIEQRRGGKWLVIARSRLSHASAYGLARRFPRAGAIRLRAVLPGDARNSRSASPTLTIKVV
jgi:hypothetical protein